MNNYIINLRRIAARCSPERITRFDRPHEGLGVVRDLEDKTKRSGLINPYLIDCGIHRTKVKQQVMEWIEPYLEKEEVRVVATMDRTIQK